MLKITQFNPQVGDVESNVRRAEAVLAEGSPKDIDLLILPEMAFSGKYYCGTCLSRPSKTGCSPAAGMPSGVKRHANSPRVQL